MRPSDEQVPETVTEAIQWLQAHGYDTDDPGNAGVIGDDRGPSTTPRVDRYADDALIVRHTYRFEGETDPGDEAIVLGVELAGSGEKRIIVSAYGPDADPYLVALVDRLTT